MVDLNKTINDLTAASSVSHGTNTVALWKGGAIPTQKATIAQLLGTEQTQAEDDAEVTPISFQHLSDVTLAASVFRFMTTAQVTDVVTRAGLLDVSAAIQSAIDTAKPVLFPDGLYLANNLTADNTTQTFHFFGNAVIKKNANGPLITFSGQQNAVFNGRFDGDGTTFTGDNIVKTVPSLVLDHCSSRNVEGRPVYDSDGNGLRIISTNSRYETLDTSADGWDIVVEGEGLYSRIIGITTAQATGGFYFNQTGSAGGHAIFGNQFGKLKMVGGNAGNYVHGNRVGGLTTLEKQQLHIDGNALASAADVTIGDGTTAFSGIVWGPGNTLTSGAELTLTDGLIDCEFHGFGHLRNNGVTITDNTTDVNDIYDGRASYSVAWTDASGGTNVIGDGTLQSFYTQRGRKMSVQIHLQIGSSTTFGTGGQWNFSLPKAMTSALGKQVGNAQLIDATGNFYQCAVEGSASATTVRLAIPTTANSVTKTTPFTWADGDRLFINFEYEL
jgi:hypothetical protein